MEKEEDSGDRKNNRGRKSVPLVGDIPVELWQRIYMYIYEADYKQIRVLILVCKTWKRVTLGSISSIDYCPKDWNRCPEFLESMKEMTSLTSLKFSCGNGIRLLKVKRPNLVSLSLIGRGKSMPHLHFGISSFTHLTELKLANFALQDTLIHRFSAFTNLESVGLYNINSNNRLLPVIATLTNLTFLDVKAPCESVQDLTERASQLSNLTELHLSIGVPPGMMSLFSNLTVLHLSGTNTVPDLRDLLKATLKSLRVNNKKLGVIPTEIQLLTNLTDLDLSLNWITIIPVQISALVKLEALRLHWNRIEVLPPELFALTNLKVLDMSHNRITVVPETIGLLTNLTSMNFEDNNFLPSFQTICEISPKFRL